jgi:hypothetical protein
MLIVSVGSSFGVPIGERDTEDYRRKSAQERERQIQELAQDCAGSIENAANLPPDQSIPVFGNILKRLGGWQRPDTLAVYHEAQSIVLSIPGHAIYYRDKIDAAKEKVRSGEMSLNEFHRVLIDAFQTLEHLPSEETVEVLGELGKDPFGRPDSKDPADYKDIPGIEAWDNDLSSMSTARVSDYAYNALGSLGIEPPPYRGKNSLNEGKYWGPWWEEVKSGKRKYRFKGSSVEHSVNAPPGTLREVRRPGRQPGILSESRGAGKPAEPEQQAEPPIARKWPLFAGLAAVLAAVVVLLIRRKSRI